MPRIPFTDLASSPEFKSLPVEDQQKVSENYWDEVAVEQPDRAEFYGQMRDASKSLFDLKAKRADAAPVQRRFLDAQVQDTAFALSLGDEAAAGRLTPEGRDEAIKLRDTERAERQAQLDKTASLFKPEVQQKLAPDMDAMRELAAKGGVFGTARLDARAADILPGGQKDVVATSKAAYESLRNNMAADYDLAPEELDDVIRHQLDLQSEPVSRDAFGTPYIKDEVIAAGPAAAEQAIKLSTLPWSLKQEMVKDLPAKIDRFRSGVLERVRTETPDLAKQMGIDQPGDEDANFQTLVTNLNDTRTKQFAGGFEGAFAASMELLERGNVGTPKDRSGLFRDNGAFTEANYDERVAAVKADRTSVEMVNALSSQFNKSKTEIWGTDAAAFGSGAYSVTEAVGLSLMTSGLGTPVALSRIATMGKTGARLATFTNKAIAVAPVAGFAGAKTAASTYEQALEAGKTEDEAFDLAAKSGAIEAGVTMLFSGLGAGGVEDVGQQLAGGALRQSARESAKSAYRMFGEKLALGIAGEQFEENLITALDAVAVQAKIDPSMTVDDFKKQIRDTALVTLAVSGPTVGAGALRETLAAKPTYQKTDNELKLEADLNLAAAADPLRDRVRREGGVGTALGERLRRPATQPGAANLSPTGQAAADATEDGGAPAPGAPAPVAPGGTQPVAPAQGPTGAPAEVPGVQPAGAAQPVLVRSDSEVDREMNRRGLLPPNPAFSPEERQADLRNRAPDLAAPTPAAPAPATPSVSPQAPLEPAAEVTYEAENGDRLPAKVVGVNPDGTYQVDVPGVGGLARVPRNRLEPTPAPVNRAPKDESEQELYDDWVTSGPYGGPEMVTVYRVAPVGADPTIRAGTWVSANTDYLEDYAGADWRNQPHEILEVPAAHLRDAETGGGPGDTLIYTPPIPTPTTNEEQNQVEEAGGLPPVEGQPAVAGPAVQAEEGAAQRQGQGAQEVAEPPAETFREQEPRMAEVFEELRKRDPETQPVNTESPRFKALVTELKDKANRVGRAAGRMLGMRADIDAARVKVEKDRDLRRKAINKKKAEREAAKPLDVHQKRIKELTGVGHGNTGAIKAWLVARGMNPKFTNNKDWREVALRERNANSKTKTDRIRDNFDAMTDEAKEVVEAFHKMRKKGAEEKPTVENFMQTRVGQAIEGLGKIRSKKWYVSRKLEVPEEYDDSKTFRVPPQLATRIFSDSESAGTIDEVSRDAEVTISEVWDAIWNFAQSEVTKDDDQDAYNERKAREAEDADLAFAEAQLELAVSEDTQVVDLAEVRNGDRFTIGGVEYTATKADVTEGDTQTSQFVLRGEGPLNRTEVGEDFFAESVTATPGSLAGIDPAEVEAFRVAQENPEFYNEAEPAAPATEPAPAPEPTPAPSINVDEEFADLEELIAGIAERDRRIAETFSRQRPLGLPTPVVKGRGRAPSPAGPTIYLPVSEAGPVPYPAVSSSDSGTVIDAGTYSMSPSEEVSAVAEEVLGDADKTSAADELGHESWTPEAKRAFTESFAEWVSGARKFSKKLTVIFEKVLGALRASVVAGSIYFATTSSDINRESVVYLDQQAGVSSTEPTVTPKKPEARKSSPENGRKTFEDINFSDFKNWLLESVRGSVQTAREGLASPALRKPLLKRADFGSVEPTTDAFVFSNWVSASNDNDGKPFVVIDKKKGFAYVFSGDHKIEVSSRVLVGSTVADVITPKGMNAPIAETRQNVGLQVTPAGRFDSRTSPSRAYGEVVPLMSKNAGSRVAIHKVFTKRPSEKRLERLEGKGSHRISLGCVNLPKAVSQQVNTMFSDGGVVYVLPETPEGVELFEGFKKALGDQTPVQESSAGLVALLALMLRSAKRSRSNGKSREDALSELDELIRQDTDATAEEKAYAGKVFRDKIDAVWGPAEFAEPAAEPATTPYSKDAMVETLGVTPEQAEAVDVLIRASGLDVSKVVMTRGGSPGVGALSQEAVLTDAEYQRHADLEARKDSLTPEELEEAQMLVEQAAMASDFGSFGYHGSPDGRFDFFTPTKADDFPILGTSVTYDRPTAVRYARDAVYRKMGEAPAPRVFELYVGGRMGSIVELRRRFEESGKNWDSASPKDVTAFALEQGFSSLDISETGLGDRGEFVVLDPSQIKSADPFTGVPLRERFNPENPSILFQDRQGNKGSIEFLQDGRTLIRGLQSPDVSTAAHEFAHLIRRQLLNRDAPVEGITDEDIQTVEQWAGAKDGKWSVAAEEKWARGWERYLADGKAPVAALQAAFDKFAKWLGDIYGRIAGSPIDIDISPEVRAVMDKLVTRNIQRAPQVQTPPPQAQTETTQPVGAEPAPSVQAQIAPEQAQTPPPPPAEPTPAPVAEIEDPDLVGMQNAATDRRRQRAGLPPRFAPARFSNQAAWDEAMRQINKDPAAGRDLVNDLRKSPRSIGPVETALYTHELLVRTQRTDDAYAAYNKNPNPETEAGMREAAAAEAEAILTAERIGTIEGRALQARKILVHQDFSIGRLVAKATAANGGKAPSADQMKEIAELHKKLQDVQTELAAAQEQLAKEQAERVHVTVVADYKKGLRETKKRGEKSESWIERKAQESREWLKAQQREGRVNMNLLPLQEAYHISVIGVSYIAKGFNTIGTFTTQLVKDFGRKYLPFRNDIFAKSQELYSTAAPSSKVKSREDVLEDIDPDAPLNDKAIFQLVRHYINEGVDGFEPVMQAVLNDLREFYPDLTLREVHDAYSKYGQTRIPSQEEDLKKARNYKELSRLMSQLEDAQRGLAPLKTGLQREKAEQNVRDLTKQVKDTMRRMNIRPTDEDGQLRSSFDAIKTRLRNEYEDLDTAIRKGEARKERSPQTFTPEEEAELKALRQRRDDRKADYEAIFKKKGLTDEQRIERAERLLDRRIAEERDMLEKGILKRNREMLMGPFTPALKSRRETLDKLKAERRELQKAARPKTPELEQKYKRDLASLERRIKEEEKLLAEGLTARQKDIKMGKWTPEMAEMQARLDAFRDARRELAESRKPEKDEAAAAYERATKAIEASIKRYQDILAGVAKADPGKKFTVDAEMAALLDQRDALRDAAAALRAMDPARIDKKKQAVLKALDKSITEITRKIQDGDLSTKGRTDFFANDPDVVKIRAARDLLNKTLAAMRKDALPKRTPEEIRNSRDQKLIENKIAKLRDRLARGDYSKRPKLPPPEYAGRDALLKEKKKLEEEFNRKVLELQLAQRSKPEVIFGLAKDILFSVSRALQTSIDAGAFARQAGLVNLIRPKLAMRNFPANFSFSEKMATKYEIAMESDPRWARAKSTILSLTSWRPGFDLKAMEEDYQSRLADKFKPVLASKRAYVTYLNLVRFTYFNALADSLPATHQTQENLDYLANAVNALSGRGNLKIIGMPKMTLIEQAAGLLSALLFSPRYWWSRLQVLGNLIYIPLDAMSGFRLGRENTRMARKIVAKEYARLISSYGVVFSLLAFAKDFFDLDDEEFKIESDPRSGDFGKVKIGDSRIDFGAGLLQNVVFGSRFVTGEKVREGTVTPLAGPDAGIFNSRAQLAGQMLRTKASPIAGSLVDLMVGKDINLQPTRWETELIGLYVPLQISETYEQIRQLGWAKGSAASLATAIGVGVQVHGDEDYELVKDVLTGRVLEPVGIKPGTFFIDQSRYEQEVKEKGWVIPKSKGLPTF